MPIDFYDPNSPRGEGIRKRLEEVAVSSAETPAGTAFLVEASKLPADMVAHRDQEEAAVRQMAVEVLVVAQARLRLDAVRLPKPGRGPALAGEGGGEIGVEGARSALDHF